MLTSFGEFFSLHRSCNAEFRNGDFSVKRQGRKQVGETVTAKVSCSQGDFCNDLERHDYKNYFSNQNSSSNNSLKFLF